MQKNVWDLPLRNFQATQEKRSALEGDVLFSIHERVSWHWQTENITKRSDRHLQLLYITGVQRSGLECLIFFSPNILALKYKKKKNPNQLKNSLVYFIQD